MSSRLIPSSSDTECKRPNFVTNTKFDIVFDSMTSKYSKWCKDDCMHLHTELIQSIRVYCAAQNKKRTGLNTMIQKPKNGAPLFEVYEEFLKSTARWSISEKEYLCALLVKQIHESRPISVFRENAKKDYQENEQAYKAKALRYLKAREERSKHSNKTTTNIPSVQHSSVRFPACPQSTQCTPFLPTSPLTHSPPSSTQSFTSPPPPVYPSSSTQSFTSVACRPPPVSPFSSTQSSTSFTSPPPPLSPPSSTQSFTSPPLPLSPAPPTLNFVSPFPTCEPVWDSMFLMPCVL